jgi:hypothetical protein
MRSQLPNDHFESSEPPGHDTRVVSKSQLRIGNNTLRVLDNVCTAMEHAQRSGICCDSFTILRFNDSTYDQKVIELCQVTTMVPLILRSKLQALLECWKLNTRLWETLAQHVLDSAEHALQAALCPSREAFIPSTLEEILDRCSLAAQLLSLAFLSYIKAHVGPIQTFSPDSSVQVVKLFGCRDLEKGKPCIMTTLYRFTCLDEMI